MSFSITCFRDLVQQYPTWDALRIHLQSAEGGKLRVVQQPNSDDGLVIIRYTKNVSDMTKEHVRMFRSVVWDTVKNRPVSVAPVKAERGDPPASSKVRISDFVDGTMLQGWCRADEQPELATRTSLGAKGTFYSDRSFADLFGDATKAMGGTEKFLASVVKPGEFVSFVLQHPEHKIVAQLPQARIYVVAAGKVLEDGTVTMSSFPVDWPDRLLMFAPMVYEESHVMVDGREGHRLLRAHNRGFAWQGLVFQEEGTCRRWRLRNPEYQVVRTLRGAEANMMERFLRLRATGQMKKYLSYFREESNEMWTFEQTLRQRSQELYDAYNDVKKQKEKTMKDLPFCLRPHVYALHGKYLSGLPKPGEPRAEKVVSILKADVVDYVNGLAQEDQLKLMEGDAVPVAPATAPAAPAVAEAVA
jgi:hypothetical protein